MTGRTIMTPEEGARAALSNAIGRLARAEKARDAARTVADEAQREFERAKALADYAGKHPDLS